MSKQVGAFITTCEEDVRWAAQLLAEVERMGIPFSVHFDRCSQSTVDGMALHHLCVGYTRQDDPSVEYTEMHKQGALDILSREGFDWALHWDADETWEKLGPTKLQDVVAKHDAADYLKVLWLNLWGDKDHIRVDTLFNHPPRVKLYNLQHDVRTGARRRWMFDHKITYGCKMADKDGRPMNGVGDCVQTDLACLHHGNMTREMREFHKARWDRIYTQAVGNNPYGFWNYQLDEVNHPPTVIDNLY